MKVGDRVRVVKEESHLKVRHQDESFRNELRKLIVAEATLGNPTAELVAAINDFIQLREYIIVPELGEESIVLAELTDCILIKSTTVYEGNWCPYCLVDSASIEVIESNPYEGYTKTSEGFLTNEKNWDRGLNLV